MASLRDNGLVKYIEDNFEEIMYCNVEKDKKHPKFLYSHFFKCKILIQNA